MSAVNEISRLVRTVSEGATASVVSIGRHGRGTGFVVDKNRVITNAHNLRDRTTQVRFSDGRSIQGTITGSDVDGDLVVLDIDTGGAAPLAWSDRVPEPGDVIVTVAAGRNQTRATWGQVTAVNRSFPGPRGRPIAGAVEHTAPSAAGSSGAPVLDAEGRVVAINTHRLEHGFYLARSADQALRDAVVSLAAGANLERVTLGVALAAPHVAARLRKAVGLPERPGLLVRGVVDGSPASAAGIQEGDLLVKSGDRDLVGPDDLFAVLATVAPGDTLQLSVVRGAEESAVSVTFPGADEPRADD
jgi:S1-C subfamily serine protease